MTSHSSLISGKSIRQREGAERQNRLIAQFCTEKNCANVVLTLYVFEWLLMSTTEFFCLLGLISHWQINLFQWLNRKTQIIWMQRQNNS